MMIKHAFPYLPRAILLFIFALTWKISTCSEGTAQTPTNFVIIISDDQNYDTTEKTMPLTRNGLFNRSVKFTRAYVTTPKCCPSRASILTGSYAARHAVYSNTDRLDKETVIHALKNNGYFTGLVGKYMNSWDGSPRPEYDFWVSYKGGSITYYAARLNVQGAIQKFSNYVTYVLRDYAVEFLDKAQESQKPFVLVFAPNAPHEPFTPALSDQKAFSNLAPFRPPSFNEKDRSDKPAYVQRNRKLTAREIKRADDERKSYLAMQLGLDRAVNSLFKEIEARGLLPNTVIFYISDNGLFWGEHGFKPSKDAPYEEAVHVPCYFFHPAFDVRGQVSDNLVGNIDIAPTIYDITGITPSYVPDGISWFKLLSNQIEPRSEIMLESNRSNKSRKPFVAIHTGEMILVDNENDKLELYDLKADPYQLENVAAKPKYEEIRRDLFQRLTALAQSAGRGTFRETAD